MRSDNSKTPNTVERALILRACVILLIGSGAGLVYNSLSATGIPLRTPDRIGSSGVAVEMRSLNAVPVQPTDRVAAGTLSTSAVPIHRADQVAVGTLSPSAVPIHQTDRAVGTLSADAFRVNLVDLAGAKRAYDLRDAVFVDARSPDAYAAGHIPGARNLPVYEFETRGREALADLPGEARIITYCAGTSCQSSVTLARLLTEKLGYSRVSAFHDGWHAWSGANYPTVAVMTGKAP